MRRVHSFAKTGGYVYKALCHITATSARVSGTKAKTALTTITTKKMRSVQGIQETETEAKLGTCSSSSSASLTGVLVVACSADYEGRCQQKHCALGLCADAKNDSDGRCGRLAGLVVP